MKKFNVTVNGNAYQVEVEEIKDGSSSVVSAAPAGAPVTPAAPQAPAAPKTPTAPAPATGDITVKSPMPGTILSIKTAAGSAVKKGDILVILEAMKMENEIIAPQEGTVKGVHVAQGASVNTDDVLVSLG